MMSALPVKLEDVKQELEDVKQELGDLKQEEEEEVESEDRSQSVVSSKISAQLAKGSENFIHGLKYCNYQNSTKITVNYIHINGNEEGFKLEYINKNGKKRVIFKTLRNREECVEVMKDSDDLEKMALHRFKDLLKLYQGQIRYLEIFFWECPTDAKRFNFKVTDLSNLLELRLDGYSLSYLILSKTNCKLRVLEVSGTGYDEILANCPQLYSVQNQITAHDLGLDLEQFSRLSTPEVKIHVGRLSEMDIFNIVVLWQTGQVEKHIDTYRWNIHNTNFKVEKLFNLFGAEYKRNGQDEIEIDHDINKKLTARLRYCKLEICPFRQIEFVPFPEYYHMYRAFFESSSEPQQPKD